MSISEVAIWILDNIQIDTPREKDRKKGREWGWSDDLHITSQIQNQIPLSIPVI